MVPIILGCGQVPAPAGALVIDHKHGVFWRDGMAYGHRPQHGGITQRFKIMAVLISSMPGFLSYDALVESLWGDDEDGGPAKWRSCVSSAVVQWRPMLDELCIIIRAIGRQGMMTTWATDAEVADAIRLRNERGDKRRAALAPCPPTVSRSKSRPGIGEPASAAL